MIIGVDIGASATKFAAYKDGEVLFTYMEEGKNLDIAALLSAKLDENGYTNKNLDSIALTGVGAEDISLNRYMAPVKFVPEFIAVGEGGTWLSNCKNAVVISLGTGMSLVMAKDGEYRHIGGSGVGSGTVRGLSKRFTGCENIIEVFELAKGGDLHKVDIQISDLFSGTDTLPSDLTASNLAKPLNDASNADLALGIINMVLEVAGSHAALACGGYGINTVIVTGGLSQSSIASWCFAKFTRLYKPDFIIPRYSGFATAIGAARRVSLGE